MAKLTKTPIEWGDALRTPDAANLYGLIVHSPETKITTKVRSAGHFYTIHRWKNWLAVECPDGTRALLAQTNSEPTADNFILEVLAEPFVGYKVVAYDSLGKMGETLYNFIAKANADWKTRFEACGGKIEFEDGETWVRLETDRQAKQLLLTTNAFTGVGECWGFGLDYERGLPDIPKILLARDDTGRKHSTTGPAVISPDENEAYYLHGQVVSRHRHETWIYDLDKNAFVWVDGSGRLHSDTFSTPSYIDQAGKVQYHSHGLLHNPYLAANKVEGDGWVSRQYWIYGNAVSLDEVSRFSPRTGEIVFREPGGKLDRADGPAYTKVWPDGSKVERYYRHGLPHNSSGPAVINSVGIEFWENGKFIRAVGFPTPNDDVVKKEQESEITLVPEKTSAKPKPHRQINLIRGKMPTGERTMTDTKPEQTRVQQGLAGFTSGMKRRAVQRITEKAATAAASALPFGDNKLASRFVQMSMLYGGAELVERLPAAVCDKVGLTQERRDGFGKLSRNLGGEILGRDSVDFVGLVAPMIVEAMAGMSVKDLKAVNAQMAENQEQNQEQPAEEQG